MIKWNIWVSFESHVSREIRVNRESTLKEDPMWYYNLVIPTGTMFSIVYVLDVIDNPFILDISYSEEEIVQHEWINKST